MQFALLISAVLGGLLLLSRKRDRFRLRDRLRPVDRFPVAIPDIRPVAAQLPEAALEAQTAGFRRLIERGEWGRVETSLRPGPDYAMKIRALAEIGSEEAVGLIESQLTRPLTSDLDELSWYRADLARSLRELRERAQLRDGDAPRVIERVDDCLTLLLSEAGSTGDILARPNGALLAGELVRFEGFGDHLIDADPTIAVPAIRVFRRALEGIRGRQLPLALISEIRAGELVSELGEGRPVEVEWAAVGAILEGVRLLRRADHAERFLGGSLELQESLHWQYACLAEAESRLIDHLREIGVSVGRAVPDPTAPHFEDWLAAADDLRIDILPSLCRTGLEQLPARAVPCLRWSPRPEAITILLDRSRQAEVAGERFVVLAILRALRRHPSPEAERALVRASRSGDMAERMAAFGSLGWWEPTYPREVLAVLRHPAGSGVCPWEMRFRADAALGRLGEREALVRLRRMLGAEEPATVASLVGALAAEGVSWLWPDIDRLVDSEDLDVAFAACEALECVREDLFGPLD